MLGFLFCPVSFKTIYFVLYYNLVVVLCELHLDGVHIGAIPKFHRFTNQKGDRAFGSIEDLCPWVGCSGLLLQGAACGK